MKTANAKVRSLRGFTLIELLVVVAIIALLISILLPSLSRARNVARMVKCQAILKQYGTANHMYANESEEWFVAHRLNKSGLPWYRNTKWRAMLGVRPVPPSSEWPAELYCPNVPADRRIVTINYGNNGTNDGATGKFAPAVEKNVPYNLGDYHATNTGTGTNDAIRTFRPKVRSPSGKIQNIGASDWNTHKNGANWQVRWDLFPDMQSGSNPIWGGGVSAAVSYRHDQGANPLMFDGHVEWRHKSEVVYFNASNAVDKNKTNALWDQYR